MNDSLCLIGEKCIDKSDQYWLLEQENNEEEWQPKECTTSQGEPGLTCFSAPDQRCLELPKWCNRFNTEMERQERASVDYSLYTPIYPTFYKCGPGKFDTSVSITICSNSTLMANAPCPGSAKRCTGSFMECIPDSWDLAPYSWDLDPNGIPLGVLPSCLDGSDKNLTLSVSMLDISTPIWRLQSPGNYSSYYEVFDEAIAIGNITISPYTGGWGGGSLQVYDGFLTILGDIESLTEEECSKMEGFACVKANTKVCLNSDLRCNEHPDCDDASDEEGCEEKNPLGAYRCPSPHHNKENNATFTPWVTIFATRCDLKSECWGGVDENECNKDWAIYYVIGKTFLAFLYIKSVCIKVLP